MAGIIRENIYKEVDITSVYDVTKSVRENLKGIAEYLKIKQKDIAKVEKKEDKVFAKIVAGFYIASDRD